MATPPLCRSELARRGIAHCDYIVSGIPFSILEIKKKRALLAENARRARARRQLHHLSGDERTAAARHLFRSRRVRIFSAEYSADVHHRFPEGEDAERPAVIPRRQPARFRYESLGMSVGAIADRKGFDGRDVRPGVRSLRRFDAARGSEFSDQRLSIFAGRSFARSA